MSIKSRTIEFIKQRRTTTIAKNLRGDGMKVKRCVECKGHLPGYMKFYCEDCYKKALKDKITNDD